MKTSEMIPRHTNLEIRGPGRRAGTRKKTRQVLIRLDEEEVDSVEFYREFTGGMSYPSILKCSAVLGSLAFGFAYKLANMTKKSENDFPVHMSKLCQLLASEIRDYLEAKYFGPENAKEGNDG